ncbi:MAG: MerR family transcriptional regulator [Deltaproteobacteria bacterium]|nr:MerR family transcriptional regulator [Deltaproteobacteria bacterium]
MKIAQLSRAAATSKSTIHNYIREGLLPPPQRVGLNVSVYSPDHLSRLAQIRELRERGNGLEEIKRAMSLEGSRAPEPTRGEQSSEQLPAEPGQEKRQQIIDKAIELFNQFGYAHVRVSDITESLQMGKGTFYLYFENKGQLLLECFKRLESLILTLERRQEIRGQDGFFGRNRPRFAGFNEQYGTFAGVMNLIRTASLSSDPVVSSSARDSYVSIIEPLKRDFEAAVREGKAEPMDAELAAYAMMGAADNLCYRGMVDDRYRKEEILEFFVPFLERLMRSDGSRPAPAQPSREASAGTLTDRTGVCTEVEGLRFGGRAHVPAKMGQGEVEVDFSRVTAFEVGDVAEAEIPLELTMLDGRQASVRVDGSLVISAETAVGPFRISIRDVRAFVSGSRTAPAERDSPDSCLT